MRCAGILIAGIVLGCAHPLDESTAAYWARYKAGMDRGEFVHLWPAALAGCIALSEVADSGGHTPPEFPRRMILDTGYVIKGVPEPVAFRSVQIDSNWRSRFPGPHYWRAGMPGEYDDSTAWIVLEASEPRNSIYLGLDMRQQYMRGYVSTGERDSAGSGRWTVKVQRRSCRGMR